MVEALKQDAGLTRVSSAQQAEDEMHAGICIEDIPNNETANIYKVTIELVAAFKPLQPTEGSLVKIKI